MSHDNFDSSGFFCEDTIERWLEGGLAAGPPAPVDLEQLMVMRGVALPPSRCRRPPGSASCICPALGKPAPAQHLTSQQYRMCELAAAGLATKEIGSELGVLAATVRGTLRRAVQRLGLRAAAALPAFWRALQEAPTRFELQPGLELLMFECQLVHGPFAVPLTPAEHAIMAPLLAGASNAEISRERGTSVRTVANQVAVIFRKYGVSSRGELAAKALATGIERDAPAGPTAVRSL